VVIMDHYLPLLIDFNSSAIRLLCWKWMHEQFIVSSKVVITDKSVAVLIYLSMGATDIP
jgi:hypothetical protein